MPRKVRELEADLKKAGFENRGGKGHRNYKHPRYPGRVTISGKGGDDAKRYQEKEVEQAIAKVSE